MKTIVTALLASAFIAGPAFACGWNKTADMKSHYTASAAEPQNEEAMTTFDPATKLTFEEDAAQAVTEEIVEEEAAE